MKRRTPEEKYRDSLLKQQTELEDFAEHEFEWAGYLLLYYRLKKKDMPDDEYRACAFFQNKEYFGKPGSLTMCFEMYKRCREETPVIPKEQGFNMLRYRFRMYAAVLMKGGYT